MACELKTTLEALQNLASEKGLKALSEGLNRLVSKAGVAGRVGIKQADGKKQSVVQVKEKLNYKDPLYDKETNSINTLRLYGANEQTHFGNPFGTASYGAAAMVHTKLDDAGVTQLYKDWLQGKSREIETSDGKKISIDTVEPKRREWVVKQITDGRLDGKQLLYFRDSKVNHAKALAELINDKSWIQAKESAATSVTTARESGKENVEKDTTRVIDSSKQIANVTLPEDSGINSIPVDGQLTSGQKKAEQGINDVLNSNKTHSYLLEGPGGTGKSYTIGKVLRNLTDSRKGAPLHIIGAATAHAAKDIIGGFIETSLFEGGTRTVPGVEVFRKVAVALSTTLNKIVKDKKAIPTVIVLDEISMVSYADVLSLLHLVKEANMQGKYVKLIMLGDRAQLRAVVTGNESYYVKKEGGGLIATINGVSWDVVPAGNGLYKIEGTDIIGKLPNGYGKLELTEESKELLQLKSKIFERKDIPGTLLTENMRNPKLAKVFGAFRTDIREVSRAAENSTKYQQQYIDAVVELKKMSDKVIDLSSSAGIAAVVNDKNIMDSWKDGRSAVVTYKKADVQQINRSMAEKVAKLHHREAEFNKTGMFSGQPVRALFNIWDNASNMNTEKDIVVNKMTNNARGTVTRTFSVENADIAGKYSSSIPLFNGSSLLDYIKANNSEHPVLIEVQPISGKKIYAYGIALDLEALRKEGKADKIYMATVEPIAEKQNTKKESLNVIIKTAVTSEEELSDLLYNYGTLIQYRYEEGYIVSDNNRSARLKDLDIGYGKKWDPKDVIGNEARNELKSIATEQLTPLSPTYAMTVHKSQGTTLENVIVLETWKDMKTSWAQNLELMYTAISRASGKVLIDNGNKLVLHELMRATPVELLQSLEDAQAGTAIIEAVINKQECAK